MYLLIGCVVLVVGTGLYAGVDAFLECRKEAAILDAVIADLDL